MSVGDRDHERISRLFLEASSIPKGDRGRFLDQACTGDPELRSEIEALLRSDENPPSALQTGATTSCIRFEPERDPERIGSFRVLDRVGEGGMGVVYRAVQEQPIRREVAIKLIRRGFESGRVVARFESERQALAMMSHPSIAQVFDAGVTDNGRPFIAMEYIDGEPITDYCDRRKLRIAQRLELFIQACEGFQHAHQKAIIHRDIKPSNILVSESSGKPLPKIIDFGVAKAVDRHLTQRTLYTEAGQLIGTPEYMSPEQAAMDDLGIDTRTDVYSLGVLLYELLSGTQPFDSKELRSLSFDEVRSTIRDVEPPTPSSRFDALQNTRDISVKRALEPRALTRQLRGELDWITMRALEKDPDRRYASPNDLAADLRRHLRGEPVVASPPSQSYRIKKFVRKHRIGVSFAATLAVLLLAIAVTMTLQAKRIAIERNQALRKAAAARQVSDFLVSVFDLSGGPSEARRQLEAARARAERDYPAGSAARARLLYPLGQIYDNLGLEDGARLMARSMEDLKEALGPEDPEVLSAMHALAIQHLSKGKLDTADGILREVHDARSRVLGPSHEDTLDTLTIMARAQGFLGNIDEAEAFNIEALQRAEAALGDDHAITIRARGYLAHLRMRQDRLEEAEQGFRETLKLLHRVSGPGNDRVLSCTYMLGCIRARRGDPDEALALIREAIDGGWAARWTQGSYVVTYQALRQDPNLVSLHGHPGFESLTAPDGFLAALGHAREAAWARDVDRAMEYLRKAIDLGFCHAEALERDRRLAPLKAQPDFVDLIADVRAGKCGARAL